MGASVAALQVLACVGFGAVLLRAFGVPAKAASFGGIVSSFALGAGVLGWILFFVGAVGWFRPAPLALVLLLGVLGCGAMARGGGGTGLLPAPAAPFGERGWIWRLILAVTVLLVTGDLLEALAPPADADSVAYHFVIPKQFLANGRIDFIPVAVEGAIPLLLHLTYVPVLSLGGEAALTLWAAVTGWAAAGLLYAAARRHLDGTRSLALAAIFLSTPAVVYSGGTGQVEVRSILFVLVATLSAAEALRTGDVRYAVIAGLAGGFFAGAKYFGLFFLAACGVALLFQRRWFRHGFAFSVAAVLAGGQWYFWNAWHTGDPVFPALYGLLSGIVDYRYWDAAHARDFREVYYSVEKAFPVTGLNFLLYPIQATFFAPPKIEASRTGLGPYPFLVLPFVVAGLWRFRQRILCSRLLAPAVVCTVFFGLWFFLGTSQRVRHLVPVWPLLMLCLTVPAWRWAAATGRLRILAVAMGAVLIVQAGGAGLFSLKFIRSALAGGGREGFLLENVNAFAAGSRLNASLGPENRVLIFDRALSFFLDVPYVYAHPFYQTAIDLRGRQPPQAFLEQLNRQGIDHVLITGNWLEEPEEAPVWGSALKGLHEAGCATVAEKIPVTRTASRTLPGVSRKGGVRVLVRLSPACKLSRPS